MQESLKRLSVILEEELDRQQHVLAALKAQRAAMAGHDAQELHKQTQALKLLGRQGAKAEVRRAGIMRELGSEVGLAEEDLRMSCLLEKVPESWRDTLSFYQEELKRIVLQTQTLLASNGRIIQGSLRQFDGLVAHPSDAPRRRGYTAQGYQKAAHFAPALLNQEG